MGKKHARVVWDVNRQRTVLYRRGMEGKWRCTGNASVRKEQDMWSNNQTWRGLGMRGTAVKASQSGSL